jgi:ubiquinone/menaquinone biosynthesis C-methylase UbiE
MKRESERKHWDEFWAASRNLDDVYGTDHRIIESLTKHVDVGGLLVLEVGAGTGRDAGSIASLGGEVVALDYSEESLRLMQPAVGDAVAIVCGDATRLPFPSGSFDVVYHQGLLEHFRYPGEVLDENIRVLKRGGILLVDVPQKYHYYTALKHVLMWFGAWFAGWETEFSAASLKRLVESRGMRVSGIYGYTMSPPIWYRGLRRVVLKTGLRLPMYPRGPGWLCRVRRLVGSMTPEWVRVNTALVIGCVAKKP